MRTQGAKEQRVAVIDTPRKNIKEVVEVTTVQFVPSLLAVEHDKPNCCLFFFEI